MGKMGIVYVIIASIVIAGAAMIFGPHLLSAINSGADPTNPVEIPKAGDNGQLTAVVNETTPAPKQKAEWISDSGNIRIVGIGNGFKVEMGDASKLDYVEPGVIYFSEYEGDNGIKQANFYAVVDRATANNDLKNVVLNFRGTAVKNFRAIENNNAITIMATIADKNFQEISSSLTAMSDDCKTGLKSGNFQTQKEELKESHEIMLGSVYASSVDEREKLSKAEILFLRIYIIVKD